MEQKLGQLSASWNEGRISRWKVATLWDHHTHTDSRPLYCELGNRILYKRYKNKYRKCFRFRIRTMFIFLLRPAPKDIENIWGCDKGSQWDVAIAHLSLANWKANKDNDRHWKKHEVKLPTTYCILWRGTVQMAEGKVGVGAHQPTKYKVYRKYQYFPKVCIGQCVWRRSIKAEAKEQRSRENT